MKIQAAEIILIQIDSKIATVKFWLVRKIKVLKPLSIESRDLSKSNFLLAKQTPNRVNKDPNILD
jgi:hypothetical protein